MKYRILIVEDQDEIRDVVALYLVKEGYSVLTAKDGFEALNLFGSNKVHLVLLDIMLPGIDGFEVLDKMRQISEVPVIMLTARNDEVDRVRGFTTGVDDYVVKPFSSKELMLRISRLIKRVYNGEDEIVLQYGNLKLHTASMKLFRESEEILLTAAEYQLLYVFFKHQGQVLSREQLIDLAFGHDYDGYDRNVDSYIKRIRQKIETDAAQPQLLVTKYGAGYIFGGN